MTRQTNRRSHRSEMAESSGPATSRSIAVRFVTAAIEGVVLAMVGVAPWLIGAAEPRFESYLFTAVALLGLLWAARMLLQWEFTWAACPVSVCLGTLFLLGVWQITPLPPGLLATLAPATSGLYDQLLPAEGEVFPGDEPRVQVRPEPGSTISTYSGATRHMLLKLLAVFLLFAVVRNHMTTVGALRRLCVVALVNGGCLAMFGLIQFFTSPSHGTLYWSIPTDGSVFGPFVNRNHFAFYINICIGLGLGLLVSRSFQFSRGTERSRDHAHSMRTAPVRPLDLLNDPRTLWICVPLVLMLSSVVFCLSRGGVLALLGALTVCSLVALRRYPQYWHSYAVVLSIALALGLLTWFGWQPIEQRLASLTSGEALTQSRLPIWSRAWPLIGTFPVWGTGYGTFTYVEPLYFHLPGTESIRYVYAHNDYLHVIVEAGLLGVGICLVAMALVFSLAYRAFSSSERWEERGLVLGGLFAFTTVAIHSSGEFGLHIPAITVIVTVLCAILSGLPTRRESPTASSPSPAETASQAPPAYSFRWYGLAPVLGAVTICLLGTLVAAQGIRTATTHRLRAATFRLRESAHDDSLPKQLAYIDAAVRLAPNDAVLQLALARTYFDLYDDILGQRSDWGEQGLERLELRLIRPGMLHLLQARDLCPLWALPHLRLAGRTGSLTVAEPPQVHLARAKRLAPQNPLVWFEAGQLELQMDRPDEAAASWQQTLAVADHYLLRVLNESMSHWSAVEILERVIPNRPEVLLAAIEQLIPAADEDTRQPFLTRALDLIDHQNEPLLPEQLYLKARLHQLLDQPEPALEALHKAVLRNPDALAWRMDYARLLFDQDRLGEARRELDFVLGQQPRHREAAQLMGKVVRAIAEGGERRPSPDGPATQ